MSKVLFLGGGASQIGVLKTAKRLGHTVVVCDFSPEALGVSFADEFYRVSTTNTEAGVQVARDTGCDAVVAYATDPAALSAAEIAKQLGLPGNKPEAVGVLTHKNKYRRFLWENGFNTPAFYAPDDKKEHRFPVVVKPTDMSGSKGVTIVRAEEDMPEAISLAKKFARSGEVLVESFVRRAGYQVAGDGFVVNGRLVFRCFANEHFDSSEAIVPIGESFPSVLSEGTQQSIHNEVQRAIDAIGLENGAINLDVLLDKEGRIYLMEIGPRAGGCLIPEVIKYATGVDEAAYVIKAALGEDCSDLRMAPVKGFWASYMIHSTTHGSFDHLYVASALKNNVVDFNMFVEKGATVSPYTHSGCAIGTAILQFDSKEEMLYKMDNMQYLLQTVLK